MLTDKKKIDEMIPRAYELLGKENTKGSTPIASEGKITKTYRSQISTFGAAIVNGTLLSAISFFSDKAGASVNRPELMGAVYNLVNKSNGAHEKDKLFKYARDEVRSGHKAKVTDDILNAAIALKLAMSLYELTD